MTVTLGKYILDSTLLGGFHGLYFALLAISLALTLAHSYQERNGRLWRYFGEIAGVDIPDRVGVLLFFWGLTLGLWLVTLLAFLGSAAPSLAIGAVGTLIGARVSDSWYSHIRLHQKGFRPNPGLGTVPFYLAEAAVLAVAFAPGMLGHPVAAAVGFFLGWASFFVVLPLLRWCGRP
jgi:hypothetical protein